jgi:hypothetical protein
MEEEKKTSRFSSGINIIQRVDQLWKNCQSFKRMGSYYKWNEELDSVWLELARDLDPSEYYDLNKKEEIMEKEKYFFEKEGKLVFDSAAYNKEIGKIGYETQFEAFDEQLKPFLPFLDSGSLGFGKPSEIQIKNRNSQYKILMKKQLFLARLENKLGKGTSWEEEEEDF